MIAAHAGKVFKKMRLKRKRVLRLPTIGFGLLHMPAVSFSNEAKNTSRIQLFFICAQPKRLEKGFAEADISQPRLFKIDAQSQMIELRTF